MVLLPSTSVSVEYDSNKIDQFLSLSLAFLPMMRIEFVISIQKLFQTYVYRPSSKRSYELAINRLSRYDGVAQRKFFLFWVMLQKKKHYGSATLAILG